MAIYQFTIKVGDDTRHVYIDLKNGEGNIGDGQSPEESTVSMEMGIKTFAAIMHGRISPTQAYMANHMKIRGNIAKAIQLEGLLNNITKSKIWNDREFYINYLFYRVEPLTIFE